MIPFPAMKIVAAAAAALVGAFCHAYEVPDLQASLGMTGEGSDAAALAEGLIFHLDFEDSVVAVRAKGAPNPSTPGKSPPAAVFVDGVKGKGLLIGGDQPALAYEVKGNMLKNQGTISFWICPRNWSFAPTKEKLAPGIPFMLAPASTSGNGLTIGTQGLHSHKGALLSFWVVENDSDAEAEGRPPVHGSVIVPIAPNPPAWGNGEWHHVAVAWGLKKLSLFCDGKEHVGTALREIVGRAGDLPVRFHVGGKTKAEQSTIDEFRVYDRPLTEKEIAALMAHDRSGGKR